MGFREGITEVPRNAGKIVGILYVVVIFVELLVHKY